MPAVTVDTICAHVSETGEGEPVVLLHSGAGEARDWRRFEAALPAGYRCAKEVAGQFAGHVSAHVGAAARRVTAGS